MSDPSREIDRIRQVYRQHYSPAPQDPNYLWHPLNPVSIYYRQSQERALGRLFRQAALPLADLRALDIGCGSGGFLRYLAVAGVPVQNLAGLDLLEDRLRTARRSLPAGLSLLNGDAGRLPFAQESFSLVSLFTVFSSILDQVMRQDAASAIQHVTAPHGWLLWYDMRGGKSPTTRGLELPEILNLFPAFELRHRQSLHPPGATRLARFSRSLCDLLESVPGVKKTHDMLLLQKISGR